ncbi:MAG: penicillin-binding protein 1A [Ignavibacteriaceae bacterium]
MANNKSDFEFKKYFNDHSYRNKKKSSSRFTKKTKLIIAGIIALFVIAFGIFVISGLPSLEQLENPRPQLASKVFTSDGELLGQFYIQNRIDTKIDSLPTFVANALISTEDRNFYSHWGVDLGRVFKAIIKDVFTFSREGASTITQQLAKNLYHFKVKDENIFQTGVRKIREWITAVQIEKTFTKREILQLYLNVSYFGKSAYGVESAAHVYFNESGKELTLPQAAMIIALLKSPEYYDPVRHVANAVKRRNLVMHNMVTNNMLSEADYEKYRAEPIVLASEKIGGDQTIAPYFMEYVRQQMVAMSEKYGYDLYRDGLNIYTSLDSRMQKIANKAAADHLKEYQALFNKAWNWNKHQPLLDNILDRAIKDSPLYHAAATPDDKTQIYNRLKFNPAFVDSVKKAATTIQVGFVVIDPANGQIRAMVGGENQDFGRGLNHASGIRRQAGSAFKPFAYTVAIDNGYFPAYTLLNQKFNYNGWSPDNFETNEYGGYITLREALAHSINVIAGRLTISNMAPPAQVVKYAHKMGIQSPLDAVPSIALGTSDVSPLEMTSAYGTFANNGVHVDPISILKIEDRNGILIDKFVPEYQEAISPQTASIMVSMMRDVINYGTGAGVRRYFQYPAAGKTGTTQNYSDAWFVGYTPNLVAGVWVGFDDHRIKFTSSYGQGAKAALPIWAMFMENAYKSLNLPVQYFQMAPGIDTVAFCKTTMDDGDTRLATKNCPVTVTDIINANNLPPKCNIHGGGGTIKKEDKKGDSGW